MVPVQTPLLHLDARDIFPAIPPHESRGPEAMTRDPETNALVPTGDGNQASHLFTRHRALAYGCLA